MAQWRQLQILVDAIRVFIRVRLARETVAVVVEADSEEERMYFKIA